MEGTRGATTEESGSTTGRLQPSPWAKAAHVHPTPPTAPMAVNTMGTGLERTADSAEGSTGAAGATLAVYAVDDVRLWTT
jgi:hypothetical protein